MERELRDKLEESVNKRLEGMNEFRHQLDKQAATFVTWGTLAAMMVAHLGLAIAGATLIVRMMQGH
jgi:hypothetical protein